MVGCTAVLCKAYIYLLSSVKCLQMKPDLAQLHLMAAQQHAVASAAMSQSGFFPAAAYPMSSSTSPPPGMLLSPASSMGAPGELVTAT